MNKTQFRSLTVSALACVLVLGAVAADAQSNDSANPVSLRSGFNTLTFPLTSPSGAIYGVSISDGASSGPRVAAAQPARVYLCPQNDKQACTLPNGPTSQKELASGYTDKPIFVDQHTVVAHAVIQSSEGSSFLIVDTYSTVDEKGRELSNGSFRLSRKVSVVSVASSDAGDGFNSQFTMGFAAPASGPAPGFTDYHIFAPARWYDRNLHAAPNGPAGNAAASAPTAAAPAGRTFFYWRETRSGLPLIMEQDPTSGEAFSIAHLSAEPTTGEGVAVTDATWNVTPQAKYGSIGAQLVDPATPHVVLGFFYPSEETTAYTAKDGSYVWHGRSQPLIGGEQQYSLLLTLKQYASSTAAAGNDHADFAQAMTDTWNTVSRLYDVPLGNVDLKTVYKAAITNLEDEFLKIEPPMLDPSAPVAYGFPFNQPDPFHPLNLDAPETFDMGYIGEELPEAYELYRHGVLFASAEDQAKGMAILTFWARQEALHVRSTNTPPLIAYAAKAATSAGKLTDEGNFKPGFSNDPCTVIYSRSLVDGMEGVAEAALFARQRHNRDASFPAQPEWEEFANRFGEFLLAKQNRSGGTNDGSFPRAYTIEGEPYSAANVPSTCKNVAAVDGESLNNTDFNIRFLTLMYTATDDARYLNAAKAAGVWSDKNIYEPMTFTGGVENVNFLDKESGIEAVNGAMALYDVAKANGDSEDQAAHWLANAQRAANYLQTWSYAFDYPINDETTAIPSGCASNGQHCHGPVGPHRDQDYVYAGTRATSFIGTSGSAGDLEQSRAAYNFFRLAVLTSSDESSILDNPFLTQAIRAEVNTKLTTQLTDNPNAGPQDQYYGYAHPGLVTEATDLTNMGFYGSEYGNGWGAWLTDAELDNFVRFEDAYQHRSIFEILLAYPGAGLLRAKTEHTYPIAGSIEGWSQGDGLK